MTTPQSRIQIMDTPLLAPGVCFVCGTAGLDDRKFIDFGKQIEWYGAVYLCSECIKEVAIAIGFIPVADFNGLLEEFKSLSTTYDKLCDEYSGVNLAIGTLFASVGLSNLSIDKLVDAVVSHEADSGGVEIVPVGDIEGESETNESVDVEGSDDLFDASDFEH